MLALAPHLKIYVHLPPTDFRKSFDGLTGLVRSALQADPRDGANHSAPAADPPLPGAHFGKRPCCNRFHMVGCQFVERHVVTCLPSIPAQSPPAASSPSPATPPTAAPVHQPRPSFG